MLSSIRRSTAVSLALICALYLAVPSAFAGGGRAADQRGKTASEDKGIEKGSRPPKLAGKVAQGAIPPTLAGQLIISEFRLHGPLGVNDEFIELYNTTTSTLIIQASDLSGGLGVAASDGVLRCTIPNGTTLPARGHYLCANNTAGTGYSLSSYPSGNNGSAATTATPNATYTTEIPINTGIALFNNATGGASFSLANRLDAVGPTTELNTTYKEGTGYAPIASAAVDQSFYRIHELSAGLPTDTGNNATDFRLIAVNANATLSGASLGAPGPENLTSPIIRNATIKASLPAPCVSSSAAPNRIRSGSGNSGSLSFRRRFTNNTGASVTRLRLRIIDITTAPAPTGSTAILAATTSTTTTEAQPCPSGTITINGLTLETPPTQALGGGYNASLSANTVTLGTPLAAGASISLNMLLNISQAGSFRFFVNVEALP